MNSYNENLHASVIDILNGQNLELKQLNSELNSAMFSFYYAEGARITAMEKWEAARDAYDFQKSIHRKSMNISNDSQEVLMSAEQEKSYVNHAVSNTALAASNIQVATNSILQLASDMGSVFSIVNAADFDTEIYRIANEANDLMRATASQAELLSQHSMEASSLIAETSSATVATEAKTTNVSITNFLEKVTADLDELAAIVKTNEGHVETTRAKQKLAEGTLKDIDVIYRAAERVYFSTNNALNLNLRTTDMDQLGFTVDFRFYQSPFPKEVEKTDTETDDMSKSTEPVYPVQDYFVMLVKAEKSSTFSLAEAEKILADNGDKSAIRITPNPVEKSVSNRILRDDIIDSEGEPMVLGEEYVVFVLAQFNPEYKRHLNFFEDYITAPSLPFALATKLGSPAADLIKVRNVDGERALRFEIAKDCAIDAENPTLKVEYRCMYLPSNLKLEKELLMDADLAGTKVNESTSTRFLFNADIAEKVPIGNYTLAVLDKTLDSIVLSYQAKIDETTTDNFGNPLVEGKEYIPVVLSVVEGPEKKEAEFINSLSDFNRTAVFSDDTKSFNK